MGWEERKIEGDTSKKKSILNILIVSLWVFEGGQHLPFSISIENIVKKFCFVSGPIRVFRTLGEGARML